MKEKTNLDALIRREDFEIVNNTGVSAIKDTVSITDILHDSFFVLNLFKPDFQRETSEWDYEKIGLFVESVLNSELIPAIILWQSQGSNTFIIDGAHRLSALIAWVNDDYGDGKISRKHFGKDISDEQVKVAKETRAYIEKKVGRYEEYKNALISPDSYDSDKVKKARILSTVGIKLQWVVGDVSSAEKSFYNINQQGVIINDIELELIKSRKKPIGIATRAIMRKGQGHKYWSRFEKDKQEELENLSQEIYDLMFTPKLETPIKTLYVPLCGKHQASSLQLIYDLIKISCSRISEDDDYTGDETINCLKQTRKILRLINSNHTSSLGLHPIIYFYSLEGKFRLSAFLAFTLFVIELDNKKKKDLFIEHRKSFEEVFYANSDNILIITRKYRSSIKGLQANKNFLMEILDQIAKGTSNDKIIYEIKQKKEFDFISSRSIDRKNSNDNFKSTTKSAIFIKSYLENVLKCNICNGVIHSNGTSVDHIIRKEDGGKGSLDNGQIVHPYCNSGYKN